MSLDLYITSKTPIRKRGTGVYVRENGETRELRTLSEVIDHFPDADVSQIQEFVYETDEIWHGNITHNLNKMADHVPVEKYTLYMYLWRPEEINYTHVTTDYLEGIFKGFIYLKSHKDELLEYQPPIDPETGERWGNYEQLVGFCLSLVNTLSALDFENEEYTIEASR